LFREGVTETMPCQSSQKTKKCQLPTLILNLTKKVRKTQTRLECQRCFTESTSIAASELDERNPKSPGKRFNTPSKLSNQSTNTNCPPHIDLKTAQVERARAANEIKFLQLTHKCTLNASSAPRRKETRR